MFNVFSFFRSNNSESTAQTIKNFDELSKKQEEELAERKRELYKASKEFEQTVKEFLDDNQDVASKRNDN